MHGLIFVTWEKFLAEQFGSPLLESYREMIGETAATAPLANRVYNDDDLLHGVSIASQITRVPVNKLMRMYGRYFIINGITGRLCCYLLERVHSGQELLLTMRAAHAQLRRTPDALTPPLFDYETSLNTPGVLTLVYDSHRRLCPILLGSIEGAAERYGEEALITERTCMQYGDAACRFEIRFVAAGHRAETETPEQRAHQLEKRKLADLVLALLPTSDGITLLVLQKRLQQMQLSANYVRLSILLETVEQLQHVGLVCSTANQLQDDVMQRRFWRAPTSDKSLLSR
jgi:hypothetical protein